MSQTSSGMTSGGYGTVYTTIRRLIVGRDLTIRTAHTSLELTVTELDAQPHPRAMSIGQFGDVTAVARNVAYGRYRLPKVDAVLHNVHFRPGSPTQLVAAPVELTAEVPNTVLAALLSTVTPRVRAAVDENGIGRIWWARQERIGHLEVDATIVGATLTLRPQALVVRGRRWSLPRWLPRHSVALPALQGMLLTNIELQPGAVVLSTRLPAWKYDVPPTQWENVLAQVRSNTGLLNLARGTRRR